MGKYWDNICKIQTAQTEKGINKYGQTLEQNVAMSPLDKIRYLEEELIDGLMYCEQIKELAEKGELGTLDMGANEYQRAAIRTMRPTSEVDPLLNGALGLSGEAGEVADHIKKHLCQGHPLNEEHLIKELGDVAWYLATTAQGLGVPLSEIFRKNITKLQIRYPMGFEAERSINRPENKNKDIIEKTICEACKHEEVCRETDRGPWGKSCVKHNLFENK